VYVAIRVLTVGIVVGFKTTLSSTTFQSCFFTFALCHYLLAVVYARAQVVAVFHRRDSHLPLVALAVVTAYCLITWTPDIVYVFGAHHVLTEVYTLARSLRVPDERARRQLIVACFGLEAAAYLWLMQDGSRLASLPRWLFAPLLAGAVLAFARATIRAWPGAERRGMVQMVVFHGTGVGVALLARALSPALMDAILYHGVFWLLLSVFQDIERRAWSRMREFLTVHALLMVFLLAMTPLLGGRLLPEFPLRSWDSVVTAAGYVHILLSLATSRLNPAWIRAAFHGPEPARPAEATA
jgi:hypothetical protein